MNHENTTKCSQHVHPDTRRHWLMAATTVLSSL